MSIVWEILNELSNKPLNYKGVSVNIFGILKFKKYNSGTMRVTLNRLEKNKLIEKDLKGWIITPPGKNYLKRKQDSFEQFSFGFSKNSPKNLLVIFDIPEEMKPHREWFRFQLKKANFVMIQKSVWVGPSPLPQEFLNYIKKIKLDSNIKTFKLAKPFN